VNPGSRSRQSLLASTLAIVAASTLLGGCYARLPAGDLWVMCAIFVIAASAAPVRSAYAGMHQRRLLARRVVILGSGAMAVKLLEEIESLERGCQMVAGVIADEPLPRPWAASTTWLGPPSQLAEIVERVRAARIVVAVTDRRDGLPLQVLLECRLRGIDVEDALDFYERLTGKVAIESLKPSALILSSDVFRSRRAAEIAARVVSVVVAALGLVLSTPLLAAIAVAIKVGSRGPVLFVQDRDGKNGRPFGLLKFRTMHAGGDPHSEWVRDNVNRITPLGGWLRRFRLDELPQLVNVLKGEMNLVGPRPHPTCNRQVFTDHIQYYATRATVRPGVTGWAQVRYGYANNLEEETEKMRYDLYYIKNRSLWLDARILLSTIPVMLGGESAIRLRRQVPLRPTLAWSAVSRPSADDSAYSSWLSNPAAPRPSVESIKRGAF
jgi:exopolysaccharide biosynthesis polyprenyl glycosylphosphotransferase